MSAAGTDEVETKEPIAKRQKTSHKLALYNYWRSSCSTRVRIALAAKGIQYQYKIVNVINKEHKNDGYARQNPMKQVPTLVVDDDFSLSQSVAIMEFIEEEYPDPPLLPSGPKERAIVRKLVEIINSGIQPIQNVGVLAKVEALGGDKMEWAREAIINGFEAFEKELNSMNRKEDDLCFGPGFTLADCCLVPQVYNALRYKVDMSQFPTISKVYTRLSEIPVVRRAHPDNAPDKPADNNA